MYAICVIVRGTRYVYTYRISAVRRAGCHTPPRCTQFPRNVYAAVYCRVCYNMHLTYHFYVSTVPPGILASLRAQSLSNGAVDYHICKIAHTKFVNCHGDTGPNRLSKLSSKLAARPCHPSFQNHRKSIPSMLAFS